MHYAIAPGSAQAVLARAAAQASDYQQCIRSLEASFRATAPHLTHSPVTASALGGYESGPVTSAVTEVVDRTDRAVSGGKQAVAAYVHGDQHMAATTRATEASAPYPSDMPGSHR